MLVARNVDFVLEIKNKQHFYMHLLILALMSFRVMKSFLQVRAITVTKSTFRDVIIQIFLILFFTMES